jgi:hypothetical protein
MTERNLQTNQLIGANSDRSDSRSASFVYLRSFGYGTPYFGYSSYTGGLFTNGRSYRS